MNDDRMTIQEIALDIADESECSVIECHFRTRIVDDVQWYDTSTAPETEPEPLVRAQAYLTLRGLLERHPERPELIRIPNFQDLGHASLDFLGQS